MSYSKTIQLWQLPAFVRNYVDGQKRAVNKALKKSAKLAIPKLKKAINATTPHRPVDTKRMRDRSWRVRPRVRGADIENIAPYSSIMNDGSAPHRPPYRAIARWVTRKMKLPVSFINDARPYYLMVSRMSSDSGRPKNRVKRFRKIRSGKGVRGSERERSLVRFAAVVRGVQKKLMKYGHEPRNFVERAMPEIEKTIDVALSRELDKAARRTTP